MAIEQDVPQAARRTSFLFVAGSAVGLAVVACATDAGGRRKDRGEKVEVTPGEDLMQEHGVLERALLIENTVAEVARLETTLGIGDLSRFTVS